MNSIKSGVSLYGIRPEMVMVHNCVTSVFAKHGYPCVVTSGVGMKHSKRSLHYVGLALDYRTKHISDNQYKRAIVMSLQTVLPCCDVVLEHVGQEEEHLHVEMDPKDDEQVQEDKKYYKVNGRWPKR